MNLTKMDKTEGLSAKEAAQGMIRIGQAFDEVKIMFADGTSKTISASVKMLSKKRLNAKKTRLARKVNAGIKEILKKRIKMVD